MSNERRNTYLPYIDGLRAVAVLSVMIYHMDPSWLPGGYVGVDVFFVISGFVVTASLAGHGSESRRHFLASFYARRLTRLVPALLVVLLVTTFLYVLLVPNAWVVRDAQAVGKAAYWGVSNILLHGNEVDYFDTGAELNPFTHTWSLGVEEQFYLLAPLLLFAALRSRHTRIKRYQAAILVAGLALLSLMATYYFGFREGAGFVFYHLVFRFWELAAGVLLFLLLPHIRHLAGFVRGGSYLSASLGVSVVATSMIAAEMIGRPFIVSSVAVFGTLMLIGAAHPRPADPVRSLLASRVFVWIGKRSYGLYLWHWPVFVIARWTVGLAVWPFNLGAWVLSFLLAAASYLMVEQPIRANQKFRAFPDGIRISVFLLAISASWAASSVLFKQQPDIGVGTVTKKAADWYPEHSLLKTERSDLRVCEPVKKTIAFGEHGGSATQFYRGECVSPKEKQLFVIGDSHAGSYGLMLEQLAAEQGRNITLFRTHGCHTFLDMRVVLDRENDRRCFQASKDIVKKVQAMSEPGDIVFLSALRVPRQVYLGGQRRWTSFGPSQDAYELTAEESKVVEASDRGAYEWLNPLLGSGLKIILEAPKPIFRAHPYACVEWWNNSNPACELGLVERRDDMTRYSAPAKEALIRIANANENVFVWDPLPLMCGSTDCNAMHEGRPLFFDADHLSPYGNLFLLDHFRRELDRIGNK